MKRERRLAIVQAVLFAFALALVGKAAHVQILHGHEWAALAQKQQFASDSIPAPRGDILDASGTPLAASRELVRIAVAPKELRDRAKLGKVLRKAGVEAKWVARATDRGRAWVELPMSFLPSDIGPALAMRGVYPTPAGERQYATSDGVRRVVGRTDRLGQGVDGIELALDSILRGASGRSSVVRDARGRRFESPVARGEAPTKGHTVVLTLNRALQDIADRALSDAVSRMSARGGDIVVLDPHSGEVLAMASRRSDKRSTSATALTDPYEPGSTLKPLVAARLMALGRARPDERIETYGGIMRLHGRTIHDVHLGEPSMSLAEIIQQSSNVGIVRFADRLTPREQYELLRDFGFGAPTAVPYPSEAAGMLRSPKLWSKQSRASLAMGYELSVTPLQLAAAYAAIANGGELLQPALVKEIRTPEGDVVFKHERRVVRRVVPVEVAATMRKLLVEVVTTGSASAADLATFDVGGKSGTARNSSGGRYRAGSYTASYVGLFPAESPQFVILVKLDDPQGAYYGGKTAAPVSKVVLEAAIAARDAALDRSALARRRVDPPLIAKADTQRSPESEAPAEDDDAAPARSPATAAPREVAVAELAQDTPVAVPERSESIVA